MPSCFMEALYAEVPRIRAEQSLMLAEAASVPHMESRVRKGWWDRALGRLRALASGRRGRDAEPAVPAHRRSALLWSLVDDGKMVAHQEPISLGMLRANLGATFGGQVPSLVDPE